MARRRRLGQPDDFEDWDLYDEIKTELDDTIERSANASAAEAWGDIPIFDLERLEDEGYKDPELVEQVSKYEGYGDTDALYYTIASGDTEVWARR